MTIKNWDETVSPQTLSLSLSLSSFHSHTYATCSFIHLLFLAFSLSFSSSQDRGKKLFYSFSPTCSRKYIYNVHGRYNTFNIRLQGFAGSLKSTDFFLYIRVISNAWWRRSKELPAVKMKSLRCREMNFFVVKCQLFYCVFLFFIFEQSPKIHRSVNRDDFPLKND